MRSLVPWSNGPAKEGVYPWSGRGRLEPGYANAAISFLVRPERGGSRVITETRIVGTSPEATRAS